MSACKVAVVLSDFNCTRIFFSTGFRKKTCNVKVNETPSSCFVRTDRRTDRRDIDNSRFSQFNEKHLRTQALFIHNWHDFGPDIGLFEV